MNFTANASSRDVQRWTDRQIADLIHAMSQALAETTDAEKIDRIMYFHRPVGLSWRDMFNACHALGDNRLANELMYIVRVKEARLTSRREQASLELREVTARLEAMAAPSSPELGASKMKVLGDHRLPVATDETRLPRLMDVINERAQGKPLAKVLTEVMEEHYGSVFRRFYPRHDEDVGGYHSPKECSAFLANVTAEAIRYGFDRSPTAYRLMLPSFHYLIEHRMPYFFLAPDLLRAIMATDFDQDIDWTTLHLPYESGAFILPRGGFRHPQDGEVSMILWTRTPPGRYPPPVPLGIPYIEIGSHNMSILALCPDKAIWYDAVLNAASQPTMRIRNLFYREPGEVLPLSQKSVPYLDEDLNEEDSAFLEQIGLIAFGVFMAMNARPELLEPGKLERVVKAKGEKPRREFWSPNVIGKRYRLKREVPRIVDGHFVSARRESGTHASPRLHWRRGHLREQAHGMQRRLRKTIWIEPMIIGAQVEGA